MKAIGKPPQYAMVFEYNIFSLLPIPQSHSGCSKFPAPALADKYLLVNAAPQAWLTQAPLVDKKLQAIAGLTDSGMV